MDWIREHKTLAAILGVTGVGALGLGFVLWNSYSAYAEGLETYDSTVKKLGRLESTPLYPSKENLAKKSELVEGFRSEVEKLQRTLMKLQPEVKKITDTEFQAKLKQRITETRQKAGSGGEEPGKLPKNFAFGFDTYVNSLPPAQAAEALNDYFDAVDSIVQLALDSGVAKIESLTRSEIDAEKPAGAAGATAAPANSTASFIGGNASANAPKKGAEAAAAPQKVVEHRIVDLTVSGDQSAIQSVLNGLASASTIHHFAVVRKTRIENQKMTGPSKGVGLAKQEAAPTPAPAEGTTLAPAEGAPPKPAGPELIVAPTPAQDDAVVVMGDEKLHMSLQIDVIKYLETK